MPCFNADLAQRTMRENRHYAYTKEVLYPGVYTYPTQTGLGFEQVYLIPTADHWTHRPFSANRQAAHFKVDIMIALIVLNAQHQERPSGFEMIVQRWTKTTKFKVILRLRMRQSSRSLTGQRGPAFNLSYLETATRKSSGSGQARVVIYYARNFGPIGKAKL
jgi:hypothetical protein